MAHCVKPLARGTSRVPWITAVWLLLLFPGVVQAEGVADCLQSVGCYLQTHTHGYLDNFSILRSDTFKDEYHVASARYRASLQFGGPIGPEPSSPWGLPFDRLEYFMELRPEYESIYDVSNRFGSDPAISTSGRGRKPGASNAGLLSAFGFNKNDFEEIYQKSNLRIVDARSPSVKFLNPDTQRRAWEDLDASTTDLRIGRVQATNWDLYYPIREAYVDMYFDAAGGKNWLRFGKQQHVWGKADFFRLQDVVNPVNFADHFFIDPFDDTRIPLWSALFEHRFGDVGIFKELAGQAVWVFDRYTSLGFGSASQPWAIGFGRELNAFAFGTNLFGNALFPNEPVNSINSSLAFDKRPNWNLKNSGVGTKWLWLFGNVRVQLTDWFAFQDVPAFRWDLLHIQEDHPATAGGPALVGCSAVLPPAGSPGGGHTTINAFGNPIRVNVDPGKIKMKAAPIVAGVPSDIQNSAYIEKCGFTGQLSARYRKQNTLGVSFDWFEPNTGLVLRSENSWTANALVTDTTSPNWLNSTNIVRWVMGLDRPTMIRVLNPLRSFFLSAQAFGTYIVDVKAGRYGNPNGANANYVFTSFAQTQYWRDQLVVPHLRRLRHDRRGRHHRRQRRVPVRQPLVPAARGDGVPGQAEGARHRTIRGLHDRRPALHGNGLRNRSHAGRRLRAQPNGRIFQQGPVPLLVSAAVSRRRYMRRVAQERRLSLPSVWMPLAVAALLTSACASKHSTDPSAAVAVEGGILPTEEDYYAVDVVDPDHSWIVGSYGTVIALGAKGSTPELRAAPVHEPLFCVSFRGSSTGVIGGRGGRIFRTTDSGHSWSAVTTAGVTENVLDFARSRDPKRLWAVGPRGLVLRSVDDGATWEDRSLGKDITLNGVTFVDDQEGWIVGEFGTILHTVDGGETWQRSEEIAGLPPWVEDVTEEVALRVGIPPLTKDDLYLFDVAFPTRETGYVVAAGGFVLTTVDRGQHWTAARAGTRNTLFKLAPTPSSGLIATGVLGTVVQYRGERWAVDENISHKVFTWLRGVDFSADGALGIAVGGKAAVLLSRDGGQTWDRMPREQLAAALPGRSP